MTKGLSPAGAAGFVSATLALALAAGLCFRPPFDDEAIALTQFERLGLGDLLRFYLGGGDVHPPLYFALGKVLSMAGLGEAGLRLASLLAAITAFALILDLAIRAGGGERRTQMLIASAFLASPILYGIGDAIRWYSLFALFACWPIHRLLIAGRPGAAAGIGLGLAASTSFLAIIPALAIALWRYAWRRQKPDASDALFWGAALLFGTPGLIAFAEALSNIAALPSSAIMAALAHSAIGYFGGVRLGLLPSLLAVPLALWTLFAIGQGVRSLCPQGRAGLRADIAFIALAQGALCAALIAAGFDKPRSFLFLAPWGCALLAGIVHLLVARPIMRAAFFAALLLPLIAVLGTVRTTDRPFKREMALPMGEIVAAIVKGAPPPAHVIANSPSVGYRLHQLGYCVRARSLMPLCGDSDAKPGELVVIVRDQALAATPIVLGWIDPATRGRALIERSQFGHDAEAAIKSRLSGVALPAWLIEVEIWR